ncbi:zinc-ribbon domain-containing protein [Bradyrhizobium guangdongense]|uniref:Uncharacterized protein n=1 Tax=Bradyrhizobium guangdongense TaxID=1325090 RepID=A0A410V5L4_9BRAD|nr:zinc-ribbon domain-containing protein [Bradyrhizobium guangdongense]QAU39001.1 hypothetical protein X265_15955 [Bradyrhizobium guangdongense]QOZ60056.1 hypothetical protein XH86_15960 [Bradyrhizobium guangdongense]GGI23530.1 hypothetical protein GCM10010987_24860 [Bradyrhizobium guangdongense]
MRRMILRMGTGQLRAAEHNESGWETGALMIIWGTYVTRKIVQTGQFYCPGCAQHRSYNLRRPKKWGHLYWIPIIPMEELDRYVECNACSKAWNESVLQHDPIKEQQERDLKLAAMIARLMTLMSGERDVSSELANRIVEASKAPLGVSTTPAEAFCAVTAMEDPNEILADAAKQAAYLTDRGKEAVLRAVISVAPNQSMREREFALADTIGRQFGMTPAHVKGVVDDMTID